MNAYKLDARNNVIQACHSIQDSFDREGWVITPIVCLCGYHNFNPETGAITDWIYTPEEQAAHAAALAARATRKAEREQALAEWTTEQIGQMTAQQVRDYVNANVTDLASARVMIRRLAIGLWAAIKLRD